MKIELQVALLLAIEKVIDDHSDDGLWEYYIHEDLVKQMARAATLVFDAAQDGQEYMKRERK